MKHQILFLILTGILTASAAHAGAKKYDFPGIREQVVDIQGQAVQGVQIEFDVRLHEHKFWGPALFPPLDVLFCEMGKGMGAIIGGMLGGSNARPKSCWQVWKEDIGIKAIDEDTAYAYPITDERGAVQYPAQKIYYDHLIRHVTPTLVSHASKIITIFEFTSELTQAAQLRCGLRFKEVTCAGAVQGVHAIQKAAKAGATCHLPLSLAQLAELRANAVEACRAKVVATEKIYRQSWPTEFGPTVDAD